MFVDSERGRGNAERSTDNSAIPANSREVLKRRYLLLILTINAYTDRKIMRSSMNQVVNKNLYASLFSIIQTCGSV